MPAVQQFVFSHPTRVVFGLGGIRSLGQLIKEAGEFTRVVVVTDRALAGSALIEDVMGCLRSENLQCKLFGEVEPNPADRIVERGAEVALNVNADAIVAIGGGSSIDTAKVMSVVATFGGDIRQYEAPESIPGPGLPVVAVPTTAGTGSEVTQWAVITDTGTHRKMALGSPYLLPKLAVVDPAVTVSLPPSLTAYTGLDALTHAIEAFTATVAHPMADAFCLEGIRLVAESLLKAVSDGRDMEARSAMALAALFGGYAINFSDVAGAHCLAEALGSRYPVPHGLACAVFLVPVTEYNLPATVHRYARVARALGVVQEGADMEIAQAGLAWLKRLCGNLGLPSLRDLGVKREDLSEIAGLAAHNVSVPSNPRSVDEQAFMELLLASY
ncbi:MAG TPA: iron-containing alcohol dehydrogenase [Firmicutes bacterium]|nr:iron-containing alcohol dehydrogenase [Bacillota bacterium]